MRGRGELLLMRKKRERALFLPARYSGLPREKWKFHCLKHSMATHLLDAGADLAFVKDWLGHANMQNTTIYARLTTVTLDAQARTIFASHRVV
jgi:site-specific recombinase XerD